MRKTVMSTLVVALLLGVFGSRPAVADSPEPPKPFAVASFAGYDELIGDVKLVGELGGQPELASALEGFLGLVTRGKGLAGIDKEKPWGAAVWLADSKPAGYAFLPVEDLDALEDLFEPYIEKVEDLGDGLYEVQGKVPGQKVIVKPVDGWLFASDKPENLVATPENPIKLLGRLHKRYDLAVRLNFRNVPAEQRKELMAQLREQAQRDLRQRPGEDEQLYAIRKIVGGKLQKLALSVIRDVNTVTLGWSLDS